MQDGETRDAYRVPWGGTPSRCFAGAERLVMKQGSAYYTDGSGTLYGARLEELGDKLTALRYAADDAAELLRDLEGELDFSPD